MLWKRKNSGGPLGKLSSSWEDGVYLGTKGGTGEIIVGTSEGVWKTRTAHRRPAEERWRKESIELLKGVPWKVNDNDEQADGEEMNDKIVAPRADGAAMGEGERDETREFMSLPVPRQFQTSEEDYQKHGYTRGCPGCKALLRGTFKQKHSDQCRPWMAEAIVDAKKAYLPLPPDLSRRRRSRPAPYRCWARTPDSTNPREVSVDASTG